MFPSFRHEGGGTFAFNARVSLPPAGACTVYTLAGNQFNGTPLLRAQSVSSYLNPGTITVTGAKGTRSNPTSASFFDAVSIGSNIPNSGMTNRTFLDPGNFTVSSSGTTAVGAIPSTPVNIPAPITWVNETQISSIDRTQPLTLTWSGAPAGRPVEIFGGSYDVPTNSSASFLCIAPPGATSFALPAYILASVPATRSNPAQSHAFVSLGAINTPVPFSAAGLDSGILLTRTVYSKTVSFK
jgi:hypothetical protein